MKLPIRLASLFVVLLVVQVVAFAITYSGTPRGVKLPKTDLNSMPLTFGEWTCQQPGTRDAEAEDMSGAAVSIHRVYVNAKERAAISVYVAIWADYENELPHPPTACYQGAGHTILESEDLTLKRADGTNCPAQLMSTSFNNTPVRVLYWYEAGRLVPASNGELRDVRRAYRGQNNWPPLVKVMLDLRATEEAAVRPALKDLGEKVLVWVDANL